MRVRVGRSLNRAKTSPVPPGGHYDARISEVVVEDEELGVVTIKWKFFAEGIMWTQDQKVSGQQLQDLLIDLGYVDENVETDDLVGIVANITVRTRGGRNSSFVESVRKIETTEK